MGKWLLQFLLAAVLTAAAVYWYLRPFPNAERETFVEIERGMSSRQIAKALTEAGVVRSEGTFLVARAFHFGELLQAGEYRFGASQSPLEIVERLRRGDVYFETLTIPEGSNIFDIAAILRGGDTVDAEDFLRMARNAAVVRDLDPAAPSLEGYLFPSTYRVTHQTTGAQLCRMMTAEFRRQWKTLGAVADVHRVVTLASLVEKETALPAERPMVAAVFANRLKRGPMALQCDPTVVYAALLDGRYRGTIHKSDLESESLYNTYRHAGLPPGPIANPGYTSLKAALQPAEGDYLYFVANPAVAGSHHFSATLAEHNRAVEEYRRGLR